MTGSPPKRPVVLFVGLPKTARGGVADFAENLLRAVQAETEVRSLRYFRLYPAFTRPGRGLSAGGRPGDGGPLDLVPYLPWTWLVAAVRARRLRPELLVFQWWHPILAPSLWCLLRAVRGTGTVCVAVCHNAHPHERFRCWHALTRLALSPTDHILTLSEAVAEELRPLLPVRRVISVSHPPNLTSSPITSTVWSERLAHIRDPLVLFFGHVRPYKGLQDLIDSMPILLKSRSVTLVVAGPFYQPVEQFAAQASALGVRDHIELVDGFVPDEEVGELFSLVDVVALPYREASQSGVASLAAEFQRPVVVTAVGDLPIAAGDGGIVVPPYSPAALADGLARALDNPPAPPAKNGTWDDWRRTLLALRKREPSLVPAHRSYVRGGLRALFLGVVAIFVVHVFLNAFSHVREIHVHLASGSVACVAVLLLAARVTQLAGWHRLLIGAGGSLPFSTSARIVSSAELVRYLPGGAWHLAAGYRLARTAGVPAPVVVTTSALDLMLRLGTALAIFACSIPLSPAWPSAFLVLAAVALPLLALLAHPKVLARGVALGMRLARAQGGAPLPPYQSLFFASGWYIAGWLMRGLATYLLARSFVDLSPRVLATVVAASGLAWVVGVLTPLAPGGLGVREAVGGTLLATVMPLSAGVSTMLVARLLGILVEAGTAWAAYAWARTLMTRSSRARAEAASGIPTRADELADELAPARGAAIPSDLQP